LADLKPSPPDRKGDTRFRVLPGGQLDIVGVQMRVLLLYAWDIDASHPERFANMPKWTESAAFDIHAKPNKNFQCGSTIGFYGFRLGELATFIVVSFFITSELGRIKAVRPSYSDSVQRQ
jgi:hypothetical protein